MSDIFKTVFITDLGCAKLLPINTIDSTIHDEVRKDAKKEVMLEALEYLDKYGYHDKYYQLEFQWHIYNTDWAVITCKYDHYVTAPYYKVFELRVGIYRRLSRMYEHLPEEQVWYDEYRRFLEKKKEVENE